MVIPAFSIGMGYQMAQSFDESELVSFKEFLMANSIQVDALAQLVIEEGCSLCCSGI